jgi:hypothetical protein
LQQGIREGRYVVRRRKQTSVSRDSTHHTGILVLDFSLDNPAAERLIVRGRWNSWS